MAEPKKKSQAEKAVSSTKEKKGSTKADKKNSTVEQLQFNMDSPIVPIRLLAGAGCILFFILLLTVLVRPEGALLLFVKALIYGLFGRVGFGFLIPVSLFIGVLLLIHKDETVIPRGLCALVFMICCGCNTDKGIYYYTTFENSQITGVDMHAEDLDACSLISYPLITGQQIRMQNNRTET